MDTELRILQGTKSANTKTILRAGCEERPQLILSRTSCEERNHQDY